MSWKNRPWKQGSKIIRTVPIGGISKIAKKVTKREDMQEIENVYMVEWCQNCENQGSIICGEMVQSVIPGDCVKD